MRLYVFQSLPNNLIERFDVSQAAANFCFALIDNNCFDKSLSLVPINVSESIKNRCSYKGVIFIQYRVFPHWKILKFLNNFVENIVIVKNALKAKNIWFYNITTTNLISIILLKYLFFKRVYAIIADYNPPSNRFSSENLICWMINKMKGVISLSARTDIQNRNHVSLAGIIPSYKVNKFNIDLNNRKFLFSGILNNVNGIDMAIDIFSNIPEAELIITGKDNGIYEKIRGYKNIIFLGFLSKDEYERILENITFCLSFRDPNLPENTNNFPSKTLEYLSQGKIVISTIEYPELASLKYFYVPFTKEDIKLLVQDLLKMPSEKLMSFCNNQMEVGAYFSESKWKSMISFIEQQ